MINQVIQGDCLEVMATLPSHSIDLIATDLPYGTTACSWDSVIEPARLWPVMWHVLKPNGVFLTTSAQPFTSALVMSQPKYFRYDLIWDKVNRYTGALNANRMPLRRHETILVFYRRLPTFNKQFREGKSFMNFATTGHGKHTQYGQIHEKRLKVNDGHHHNPCSIIPIKADAKHEKDLHPTQKPVALFEYLIKTYSNPGDLVLDCTAGSGTTGVAAINTNRNFILIEKEQKYIDIIHKRLASMQPPMQSLFSEEEMTG